MKNSKKQKRLNRIDKYKHRKIKAADDFKAQLEDAWHLLAKRRKLGRKEIIIKTDKKEN
tara:strand:- start:6238 stop:6414 length:177 start_codon:yes stop_codon:yes gene_type:complete